MKTKIAEYRKKAHLTQKQAAEALGIGERLFQSYEYGTVLPSVATGIRIAKLLKTTVEELYPEEELAPLSGQ